MAIIYHDGVVYYTAIKEENMENTPKIQLSRSVYGTTDVVIYDMPTPKLVDWFTLVDVWGSRGYDRFGGGGLYFELPKEMYDIIPSMPFVSKYHIEIVKD